MGAVETLKSSFDVHIGIVDRIVQDNLFLGKAADASNTIVECLRSGGKIMACGNGGSAADAQHFSAELVGRFQTERDGVSCIALTTDTSMLTAWGNDYEFNTVFARQVGTLGREGDVLVCLSTSGNSKNVVAAAKAASGKGVKTIGLLGGDGGELADLVDIAVVIPHDETARVQEVHQIIYHAWCAEVDAAFTS